MKRMMCLVVVGVWAALPASALDLRDDKEDLKNSAKKLAEQSNYSWTSTPKSEGGGGGNNRFQPGPTDGKTEKDGYTVISSKRGTDTSEGVIKGEKAAVKTKDGWKSSDEFAQGGGGGGQGPRDPVAGFARSLKNVKLPAVEAESLVDKVKELKKGEDGLYSGDLTEEGAKELMSRGGRGGGGQAPTITDPKGTAKFWIKDGVLVKYEYNVQGKTTGGQQNREIAINRTTTVEMKDIGSTKLEVPDEAKKKLE